MRLRRRDLIQLLEDQVDYQAATIAELRAANERLTEQVLALRDVLRHVTSLTERGSQVAMKQTFVADQIAAALVDSRTQR